MDSAQAFAPDAFQNLTLANQVFLVRPLKLREWGALQAWLKSSQPSPLARAIEEIAAARKRGVPIDRETEAGLFRQAQEEARLWPPRVGSAAWCQAIEAAEGGRARFLQTAVAPRGYQLSDEEADDLMVAASGEEVANLLRVCVFGETLDPKAEAGSTTTERMTSTQSPTNGATSSTPPSSAPAGPSLRSAS